MPTNEKTKPTLGSLFAGIGGFDLGFEQAGFETKWVCVGPGVVFSLRSCVSSAAFNLNGWSLKTSRHCSIATIAKTLRSSSKALPTAGMWDVSGCLTLRISEAPRTAAVFSWSGVLEARPPSRSWLMPHQWSLYLHRLARAKSHAGRWSGRGLLYSPTAHQGASPLGLSFLLLKKTDGIRWLTGSECLSVMGFPREWLQPISSRITAPEMRCMCPRRSGSQKKSSQK